MWRPESLGEVIAERVCDLEEGDRRVGRVTVSFGRPVRAAAAGPADPWWCPVRISGTGIDLFRPIAGEDSLQALVLGLEFAADILPHQANALRPGLDWSARPEGSLPGKPGHAPDPRNAFTALLHRLERTVARPDSPAAPHPRTTAPALRAVGSTGKPATDRRDPPGRRKT
jgi:hypothetical protein